MSFSEILSNLNIDPEHRPVLLQEVLQGLTGHDDKPEKVVKEWKASKLGRYQKLTRNRTDSLRYLDGTFGRGGHYQALQKYFPNMQTLAFDQDLVAIEKAPLRFPSEVQSGQLKLVHANFSQFSQEKFGEFDMMLLDLGVSSPQLDQADRGFSFYQDGPLDMRMNQTQTVTAELIVNTATEADLIRIFKDYGEIQNPMRVVRAILKDREVQAFQSTLQLAGMIERVDGWRKKGHHPATLYFQGLRLAVNHELDVLKEALPRFMQALMPGGRLAVISFHSLEDRVVKWLFKESSFGFSVHNKVIEASETETKSNPRARSAKLRIFQKYIKGVQDELEEFNNT